MIQKTISLIGKKAKAFKETVQAALKTPPPADHPVSTPHSTPMTDDESDLNPHPRGGYYALDYKTFKRLKMLKKEAWIAYYQLRNWGRWARKTVNRQGEEPPLNPFWIDEIDLLKTPRWKAPLFNQFHKIPKHKREGKEGFDLYEMVAFHVGLSDSATERSGEYGLVQTSGKTIKPIIATIIRAAHLARYRWETPDYFDLNITKEEIDDLFDQVFGSD